MPSAFSFRKLDFHNILWYYKFMNVLKIKRIIKITALLLAFSILTALCGCSVGSRKNPEENTGPQTVRVMFPEGSTVSQIANMLEEKGVCSASEFMAAANDEAIAAEYGLILDEPENRSFLLEGYLFPDTYEFYLNESPASVLRRFLKNTVSKLDENFEAKCERAGYSSDEILTIASIIQEEAGMESEMGKVSSVLHNRLSSSRFPRLQCDVATFYLRDYVKPYVDEERYEELTELYNTYNCEGLPAGPITNPGMAAINAALDPEDTDWYFFVTDEDGVYYYAETWNEHLENCEKAGL